MKFISQNIMAACLIIAACNISSAQSLEVGLTSGVILKPETLSLKELVYEDVYLLADGDKIFPDSVDYYQTDKGYYKWYFVESEDGAFRVKRVMTGNVNTFSRVQQTYGKDENLTGEFVNPYPDFLEKESGQLWEVNYDNLYKALSDNAQSEGKLKQAKTLNVISRFGLGLAGGLAIAGIIDTFHRVDQDESPASPYLIAGVGFAAVSVAIRLPYSKKLRDAIYVYNQR